MDRDFENVPADASGLKLCKVVRGELILCETVIFTKGRQAVLRTLGLAAISGEVGPVGKTGDFWADIMTKDGDICGTVTLDRRTWNKLKNRWMRCRVIREPELT